MGLTGFSFAQMGNRAWNISLNIYVYIVVRAAQYCVHLLFHSHTCVHGKGIKINKKSYDEFLGHFEKSINHVTCIEEHVYLHRGIEG